jgi:3-methyl-2-oxobutanoate hydroxymethyltransferase
MMKKVTTSTLQKMKQQGEKITALTAYDASFAKTFDNEGIDFLLIGDSLGMVLQGNDDTLPVTVEEIAYHTRAVRKGTERALVVADMPFMSYSTTEKAFDSAATLMAAGANMVKLEGGLWLKETIAGLTERGIPVCGHLGLTPQSVHKFGGFKIQGRSSEQASDMVQHAHALQEAGCQLLVLECVPTSLGAMISESLDIPVIGIGAGGVTDGQILVMHDMIGISANYMPKFSKNYLVEGRNISQATKDYIDEVRKGLFPDAEHSFE